MDLNQRNPGNTRSILVFPAGMPRSLEFLRKSLGEGRAIIGASSLTLDPSQEKYPAWLTLPYITEPGFNEELKRAISRYDIGGIYTPNLVAWDYLNRTLQEIAPEVSLVNESPAAMELNGYRTAVKYSQQLIETQLPLASCTRAKEAAAKIELAALFRHADIIPGMCDHEKFCVLCEIARHSPRGDIVEIGSWWGKSAFILARLARLYDIGNVLCVDPWSNQHLVQNDDKGMVDAVSAQVDAEEALTVFEMNLLPYNANHVNYMRLPSVDAARQYGGGHKVSTASFGTTHYSGEIAILHIDGNHSYSAAQADIAAWSGFVVAGGWIVVDDYIWPYGDGPQRAGDEFMAANLESIVVAFVMGSALFLQLASRIAR